MNDDDDEQLIASLLNTGDHACSSLARFIKLAHEDPTRFAAAIEEGLEAISPTLTATFPREPEECCVGCAQWQRSSFVRSRFRRRFEDAK